MLFNPPQISDRGENINRYFVPHAGQVEPMTRQRAANGI